MLPQRDPLPNGMCHYHEYMVSVDELADNM